jgi:NADH-quinone oxidoreductase subunit A
MAVVLLTLGRITNPRRPGRVKRMPYESGMDPVHDTRRRFDVRFHLLAIAFLVFDVELLFLYPWAIALHPLQSSVAEAAHASPAMETNLPAPAVAQPSGPVVPSVFAGGMLFIALLALGFVYDWRKGVFQWR